MITQLSPLRELPKDILDSMEINEIVCRMQQIELALETKKGSDVSIRAPNFSTSTINRNYSPITLTIVKPSAIPA